MSKLEGLKVSLEATQTDLVQAVHSELGRFKSSGAIQQAFHMWTDQSIARGRPSCARDKVSESPLHCPSITQSPSPCHQRSSGLVHAVEWHSHKYHFPIGILQVEHVEGVDVEINEGEDASVQLVPYRSKKIRFIFEPPRWFSSLIVKIDIAMQIAQHGCTPAITWGSVPNGRHLDPLVDELHEINNLTLDRKLLAIARIEDLDYLFEVRRTKSFRTFLKTVHSLPLRRLCLTAWAYHIRMGPFPKKSAMLDQLPMRLSKDVSHSLGAK